MTDKCAISFVRALFAVQHISTQNSGNRDSSPRLCGSRLGLTRACDIVWFAALFLLVGAFCAPAQAQTLAANWYQQSPATTPAARMATALTYDSAHGQVVMFGGLVSGVGTGNDTWLWNGTNWTLATPANSPPARNGAVMAWDAVHSRVVLFGGVSASGYMIGDTWLWDGTN